MAGRGRFLQPTPGRSQVDRSPASYPLANFSNLPGDWKQTAFRKRIGEGASNTGTKSAWSIPLQTVLYDRPSILRAEHSHRRRHPPPAGCCEQTTKCIRLGTLVKSCDSKATYRDRCNSGYYFCGRQTFRYTPIAIDDGKNTMPNERWPPCDGWTGGLETSERRDLFGGLLVEMRLLVRET
jgi:hypothetical protein